MRHIEKLNKIFAACGKECTKDTTGQAIDDLFKLAEAGELAGGGSVIPSTGFAIGVNDGNWQPLYLNGVKVEGRGEDFKAIVVYDGQTYTKIVDEWYSDSPYQEIPVADYKIRVYLKNIMGTDKIYVYVNVKSDFDVSKLESIEFTRAYDD